MTQEEKQLLVKALCGYLPYGTKARKDGMETNINPTTLDSFYYGDEIILPYLRPMSSMTEKELNECVCRSGIKDIECPNWQDIPKEKQFEARLNHSIAVFLTDSYNVDWLNAHHFDYRGLIEMGLALEAPENMYKHFGDMDVVVTSVEHKDKL